MNTNKDKLFPLHLDKCRQTFLCGLVFLSVLICVSLPKAVEAAGASLYLSPGSGSFIKGDTFSVQVKADAAGIPINAAKSTIYFPADILEVLNISKEDSIFALWTEEPAFSNSSGEVSFSGGLPHPGFSEIGNIITINFKAQQEGIASLNLGEGQVLADDGKGTNVLVFIKEAKYVIQKTIASLKPEPQTLPGQFFPLTQISSPTHPQSEEWYNNNNPRFQWELAPDIKGVSFILDNNSDTKPDTVSEGRIRSKAYQDIKDGVWYFHFRLEDEMGWGESAHYRLQIDSCPPRPFEITIDNQGDSTNPNPNLYFEAEDDASGIDYYKLKVEEKGFLNLMSAQVNPFSLPYQVPGRHLVIVRAVDKAGNNTETKTQLGIDPIESPVLIAWPNVYLSGEEIFYLEGSSLPEVEIMISLEKEGKKLKNWQTLSNSQGEWSFSTKELIESGTYYLSIQAKDKRGAVSVPFSQRIEVSFSGISLGSLMLPFKKLVIVLFSILLLGIIAAAYFIWRGRRVKKILRTETREAKESLEIAFDALRKEIEARIEFIDSEPGFNPEERRICQELREVLKVTKDSIAKEIEDLERELK